MRTFFIIFNQSCTLFNPNINITPVKKKKKKKKKKKYLKKNFLIIKKKKKEQKPKTKYQIKNLIKKY